MPGAIPPFPDRLPPPRRLPASVHGIALWWCSTAAAGDDVDTLRAWLSPAETARAARFARPELAQRYIVGRASLRYVLGALLGCPPRDVGIERGRRGRPRLSSCTALDFNVSNTRDVALIGTVVGAAVRIGVDVEHAARPLDHRGLARKFCTPAEQAGLAALDDDAHRRRFLRLWTCKEAMSKATGDALAAPLRHLDVEVEPALRLAAGPPPYEPAAWHLVDAPVPVGYVATVALWRAPADDPEGLTR